MLDASVIPTALATHDQWVCWRQETRNGKPTKVPYNPRSGGMASTTNPDTWSTLARCMRAEGYDGVGFVFTEDDPFVGIDLDDCADDAGQLSGEATEIINRLDSYAEISPSGRGVKIIGLGNRPGDRSKTTRVTGMSAVEVYDTGRYFTITALKLHRSPGEVTDLQDALDHLYVQWFPPVAITSAGASGESQLGDVDLLNLIRSSAQAAKFDRLWSGDSSDYGDDTSAGDMALCCCLAFWCQNDPIQMDRLFRQSVRIRDKWDAMRGERTYGQITIDAAIQRTPDTYHPSRRSDYEWFSNGERLDGACELRDRIEATVAGRMRAVPWKWPNVGYATRALMPGTLTVICGHPGATKSFLLLESIGFWCEQGVPVRCLMLEDSCGFHLQRAVAQFTREPNLTDPEWIERNAEKARDLVDRSSRFTALMSAALDSPPAEVCPSSTTIARWIEAEAEQGARIICVDPISLATPGDKQWISDHELIARAKKSAEAHGASVILVTHPKKHPQGMSLDDVSGGAALTRAAHTVLWLSYMKEAEPKHVDRRDRWGFVTKGYEECNRIVRILKARNGLGSGWEIGMMFEKESLTFQERGLVVKRA